MPFACKEMPSEVWLPLMVDTHAHLRNNRAAGDGRMEMNVRYEVGKSAILIHIGNGSPAMLDQASVDRELANVAACLEPGERLEVYGMPLLRDDTTPEMVHETRRRNPRNVLGWKAFLSGVSNDGGNSVTNFRLITETIRALYDDSIDAPSLPVHIHAERKYDVRGRRIPMHNREWYAIKEDVQQLLEDHPQLEVVIKHVSDSRTLDHIRAWRKAGLKVYAEICPHYLVTCHEDLYEGKGGIGTGFDLHKLCWPLYKNEASMRKLREAVLAGEDWIMMGRDVACHNDDPTQESGVKVNRDGWVVGGVTMLPDVAISILIDLFMEAGGIENLPAYISGNARRVHGLPPDDNKVRYIRKPWKVPEQIMYTFEDGYRVQARPFMRRENMNWQKESSAETDLRNINRALSEPMSPWAKQLYDNVVEEQKLFLEV